MQAIFLKIIKKNDLESNSKFKDWADDAPHDSKECFASTKRTN